MMIKRGIAELVEEGEGYDTATAEPHTERAVMPTVVKRKRGRPLGSRNQPKG